MKAIIPETWKDANRWFYEGMYGDEPWMATGPLSAAPEFGGGNLFNSGKAAMAVTPLWYTCCLGDFRDAGFEFQAGILPIGPNGEPNGRVDADTFRIWRGTQNPEAAFTVLSYLLTDGADKLLPIYGAMPAIAEKMGQFFASKTADYPFVTDESWDVFKAGLSYPDIPQRRAVAAQLERSLRSPADFCRPDAEHASRSIQFRRGLGANGQRPQCDLQPLSTKIQWAG
jgi:multiple sugar transport system substrate-binding protein